MAPPVIAAVISLAGSVYAAKSASDSQSDALAAQEKARREAEAEQKRLAEASRPEGLASSVDFGSEDKDTAAGSTSDFLSPLQTGGAGLSAGSAGSQTAGLGFA